MLQVSNYLGRFKDSPELTDDMRKDAQILISKVSELLSRAGIDDCVITSGFRPKSYNAQIGGSKNSLHCYCQAIDLADPDEKIGKWFQSNIQALIEIGLWAESLSVTHKSEKPSGKWVHLQIKAPRSGNRIFLP